MLLRQRIYNGGTGNQQMKKSVTIGLVGVSGLVALMYDGGLRAQNRDAEKPVVNYSISTRSRDFQTPPLVLKGAKVSTEAQAKSLAEHRYFSLMLKRGRGISATESARVVGIETVGFDMPGYAKKGDAVWEVRIIDFVGGLNAIIWVHSESQAVKFLLLPISATSGKKG